MHDDETSNIGTECVVASLIIKKKNKLSIKI